MARKYLNNYTTLLSAAITDAATTMTVGTPPPDLAPGDYYRLQLSLRNAQGVLIKQEFVDVTAISGNDLTITRAAENSTALSWDIGARVELVETAASFDLAGGATLPHSFNKQDRAARLFELSGSTLQTAQPVSLDVDGTIITLAAGVAVTLPTLASHTDYLIYCSQSGALPAQPWDNAAPANSRAVGGFHAYHTTATINPNSIWDLGYRPTANPRGMTQCPTGDWVDIYLMDVDYGINGYSRGGVTIADGESPPKIPAIYGGNGTATYGSLTWFEAVDLAAAAGKRLLTYAMFTAAAYGVVERQAVGTDPVTTKYQAGHRSACGMEQATGCLYQWGEDINGTSATGTVSWQDITGGRGDIYTHSIRAVRLGANWNSASHSGSRASGWNIAPSDPGSGVSARASCGHMTL